MDAWYLDEIITEIIVAKDRPATTSALDVFIKILQWQFDFHKQISANVKVLKVKIPR